MKNPVDNCIDIRKLLDDCVREDIDYFTQFVQDDEDEDNDDENNSNDEEDQSDSKE